MENVGELISDIDFKDVLSIIRKGNNMRIVNISIPIPNRIFPSFFFTSIKLLLT